jgi:hypothetical protein
VHEHVGDNPGFEKALKLFRSHIVNIAACAEAFAVAVGAPFLRCDFFIGSPQWGVRLNEVAYGCGVDYRNRTEDGRIIDDAPAIARILQEGMTHCRKKLPSEQFLGRLGVKGHSYADMTVTPMPAWVRPSLPSRCAALATSVSGDEYVVPDELCRTLQPLWGGRNTSRGSASILQAGRSYSWDEAAAAAQGWSEGASALQAHRSKGLMPRPRSTSFRASRRSQTVEPQRYGLRH